MSLIILLLMAAAGDGLPAAPPAGQLPLPHPTIPADTVAAAGRETQPKLLNKLEIFNLNNYPYWAKSQGEEGTVRVSVEVSATGVVTGCRVTRSSGSADLDLGTCDLITAQGQFAPARDKRGKAVVGSHVTSVTWQLIQEGPWKVESSRTRVVYSVGANMLVSNCRVEQEPVDPDFDPRTCGQLRPTAQLIVIASPGQFTWQDWEVVLEMSTFAGAGDAAMEVGKRQGEMLFDRDITRMTINSAGRISRCETIELGTNPFVDKAALCAKAIETDHFEPVSGNADRLRTSVSAIYLRKKWQGEGPGGI